MDLSVLSKYEKDKLDELIMMAGDKYNNDSNKFVDLYHCECGHVVGKQYDGTICQECKTTVCYHDYCVSSKTQYVNH